MKRDVALEISKFLANHSTGVAHKIEYTPRYGYTVRMTEMHISEYIKDEIKDRMGKIPVHGREYR